MKVGPSVNPVAVAPSNSDTRTSNVQGRAGDKPAAEPSAKVALSDTVTSLNDSQGEGVFDAAKVERISAAIRNGQFKVNPQAIADKLIQNAQDLLGGAGKS